MSSANFGSCPVPVIANSLQKNGGETSIYPCSSVWTSSINCINALWSLAPSPVYNGNPEPAILAPRSKSKRPSELPKSQWGRGSKSKDLTSPQLLTIGLSLSLLPTGTSLDGIFGICKRKCSIFISKSLILSSSEDISSPIFLTCSLISSADPPDFIMEPISLEKLFLFALSLSASRMIALRSS